MHELEGSLSRFTASRATLTSAEQGVGANDTENLKPGEAGVVFSGWLELAPWESGSTLLVGWVPGWGWLGCSLCNDGDGVPRASHLVFWPESSLASLPTHPALSPWPPVGWVLVH